jgi:signal transduction histidine kinase
MTDPRISPAEPPENVADADTPRLLGINSVLADLPLYEEQLDLSCSTVIAAQIFSQNPLLPGMVLADQGTLVGILSRQRYLEFLLKPGGHELFSQQPLAVLWAYARTPALLLKADTPILRASQKALRRSLELQGEPIGVQLSDRVGILDVHELNIASWQIRGVETQVRYERSQAQMLQSEKMASLGRLVDGVAHEVLDPVGFIWGNLAHVQNYTHDLLTLLDAYSQELPQVSPELQNLQEDIELDYLREDLPRTIQSIQSGADRLKKLATSLQNFCHIDAVYPRPADLHSLLDGIVLLLKSRITTHIQIIRDYDSLPPVTCYSGQLSQVFMNLLSSSLDRLLAQTIQQEAATQFQGQLQSQFQAQMPAMAATTQQESPRIYLSTRMGEWPMGEGQRRGNQWVAIMIADTGPPLGTELYQELIAGLSMEQRLLKETSLAMSYRIVTAKHGGQFRIHTACPPSDASPTSDAIPLPTDTNTAFEIRLPLFPPGESPKS